MPDLPEPPAAASPEQAPVLCSARGCRLEATWVLAWNNPALHTADRRKTWVACDGHREHLAGFLDVRGFLRDVVPLADWRRTHGAG